MASGSLRCMMAMSFRHMKGNFPNSILSDIKSQHSRNSGYLFMPHVHCSLDRGKAFCTAVFEQHALNLPECSCVIKMLTVLESTKCGAFQKNNYSQTAMELARTLNRITCCGTTTNTFVIQIEILFSKTTSNCTRIQRWPSTGNFNVRKISQNNLWRNVLRGYQAGHKCEIIISITLALDASKIELGTLCGNLASVANFMSAGGFCFWNFWFNFNVWCTLSARAATTTLTADTDPMILSTICPTVDIHTFDAKSNKNNNQDLELLCYTFADILDDYVLTYFGRRINRHSQTWKRN